MDELLVMGDLTEKLAEPEGTTRAEEIATSLSAYRLEVSNMWWEK